MRTKKEKEFLEAAFTVGVKLCREAIWDQGRCNWIGCEEQYTTLFQLEHTYKSLGPDFYDGTSGIAFFLSSLHSVTKEPLIKRTALGALRQALSALEKSNKRTRTASLYLGLAGVAYALLTAAELLEEESLCKEALEQLQKLEQLPDADLQIDIIEGVAGVIPVLLYAYQIFPDARLLATAIRYGDYLKLKSCEEMVGCSWGSPDDGTHRLTGFAHGVAGVSLALLELYHATNECSYLALAEQGMAYENSWFDKKLNNWPDFRNYGEVPETDEHAYGLAWCHGAPGIGLSRLRAYQITCVEAYKQDALAAISATGKDLLAQNNYSLCHGMFGNAELLLLADTVFHDKTSRALAEAAAQKGIDQIHKRGLSWPCGLQSLEETPGLMLGLAGIGQYYLRLCYPRRIPSALFVSSLVC